MSNTHNGRPVTEPTALAQHEIELRMLAIRDHVPGLRAMAAERAMRSDHDLDFIDDIRLVVDEVCALMLASCSPADTLSMRLSVDPSQVVISASVPMRAAELVDGLSLRVLQALANSLDFWVDRTGGEPICRLDFCRLRPVALG